MAVITEQALFPVRVVSVERTTPDAVIVTFDVPETCRDLFQFKPGQHLPLHFAVPGVEGLQRRTYSIASGPGEPMRVAIKRIDGGFVSVAAQTHLKAGDTIAAEAPAGRFVLSKSTALERHLLFLAAGSGITPIIAMVKAALVGEPGARVTLIYGNRTRASMLFAEELDDLKDRHVARFDLVTVFSKPDETDAPMLAGRIDGAKINAMAGRFFDVAALERVYACGPGTLIKETRNALMALGLPRDRFLHEFFAAGGGAYRAPAPVSSSAATVAPVATGTEVVAILDGVRTRFKPLPGESVLDGALRAGVKAPFACKGGMCCTCRAKLVEGQAPMAVNYSLEAWEVAAGFVLTCQAMAEGSAVVVVDFDAM